MGGWARTQPTVYFVAWPDEGVFKAGYSERQRWRGFVLRGATLVRLVECSDHRAAFALETECLEALATLGPLAWGSADDAAYRLGVGGGGWRECYRIGPEHMQRICASIASAPCASIANAVRASNARTYGRTDVLTNGYSPREIASPNASRTGGLRESSPQGAERGADAPPTSVVGASS